MSINCVAWNPNLNHLCLQSTDWFTLNDLVLFKVHSDILGLYYRFLSLKHGNRGIVDCVLGLVFAMNDLCFLLYKVELEVSELIRVVLWRLRKPIAFKLRVGDYCHRKLDGGWLRNAATLNRNVYCNHDMVSYYLPTSFCGDLR